MQNGPSILVIEDNSTTARTLALFLEAEKYDVHWSGSGALGLAYLEDFGADLVLLDLMLPDLDGISVCKKIRAKSQTPIVMLTAKTTEDEIVTGLEAGADDYVCKPFGSKELLARIRRCLRSNNPLPQQTDQLALGEIAIDADTRQVTVGGKGIKLTKSEFEILFLLMKHVGRVFTRDQIIDRAFGPDFDGFDRTVDTHIWSLRKKIGEPRGAPRYIHSELGVGYRFQDSNEP
ncbi:response regulator transcription factor [Hyphomonas sp.]|uniref:response regulator transcription factor n=1 Tax=Hyphomonas sp. TaxID=87 RepID=UPI003D26600F|tara:strand:+ start:37464 stop:38162 length:699 start_codon:yes stop_codon:yes gene_type:complete